MNGVNARDARSSKAKSPRYRPCLARSERRVYSLAFRTTITIARKRAGGLTAQAASETAVSSQVRAKTPASRNPPGRGLDRHGGQEALRPENRFSRNWQIKAPAPNARAAGTRASANTSGPDFIRDLGPRETAKLGRTRHRTKKTCFFCRTGSRKGEPFPKGDPAV
jgi:hypothetical protein